MQNLQKDLIQLLKDQDNLVIDGELNKNKIIESALKVEPYLIKLLLSNETFKKHFFKKVDEVLVFDKIKFQRFVNNKSFLPDSYTAFKNKIGLAINDDTTDNFIKAKNDVVLAWPHKDCVLEGGQTKEDQKRNEIFWNETLAPDNVDRLLDAKTFTNFKKYDKDGGHKVTEIKGDENLILKGNNLLVLSSLLKTHRGKIKLIYIDPPYNTGNDSFGYNDNFNHSTWLTFMKNRLVIAKELLRNDGVIFVHCDNNEQAYLKVLMDEIYFENNFVDTITVVNNPRGRDYGGIANMHEFIHIYGKTSSYDMYKTVDKDKKFPFKDKTGSFETRELRNRNTAFHDGNRPNLCYPFYVNPKSKLDNDFLELSIEPKEGFIKVMPAKSQGIQTVWRWGKPKAVENLNINVVGKAMQEDGRFMIVEKYRDNSRLARSVWWDKEVNSEKGTVHLRELFNRKVFSFPKPETLLSRIIEISTKENDLILDYHIGSGTTATAAHKMKRKYIGIEQMDYINTITTERLKKVIEGEQGGISKDVNWQGGGSFIYAELMQYNQHFIDKIQNAKSKEDLLTVWDDMQDKAFLSYQFDKDIFNKRLDAFKTASLETMQHYFIEVLDKNQLYVNFSEIEDKNLKVSEEDKELNYSFYKK